MIPGLIKQHGDLLVHPIVATATAFGSATVAVDAMELPWSQILAALAAVVAALATLVREFRLLRAPPPKAAAKSPEE